MVLPSVKEVVYMPWDLSMASHPVPFRKYIALFPRTWRLLVTMNKSKQSSLSIHGVLRNHGAVAGKRRMDYSATTPYFRSEEEGKGEITCEPSSTIVDELRFSHCLKPPEFDIREIIGREHISSTGNILI